MSPCAEERLSRDVAAYRGIDHRVLGARWYGSIGRVTPTATPRRLCRSSVDRRVREQSPAPARGSARCRRKAHGSARGRFASPQFRRGQQAAAFRQVRVGPSLPPRVERAPLSRGSRCCAAGTATPGVCRRDRPPLTFAFRPAAEVRAGGERPAPHATNKPWESALRIVPGEPEARTTGSATQILTASPASEAVAPGTGSQARTRRSSDSASSTQSTIAVVALDLGRVCRPFRGLRQRRQRRALPQRFQRLDDRLRAGVAEAGGQRSRRLARRNGNRLGRKHGPGIKAFVHLHDADA